MAIPATSRDPHAASPEGGAGSDEASSAEWTDADGENYVFFAIDDGWPESFGAASVGAP